MKRRDLLKIAAGVGAGAAIGDMFLAPEAHAATNAHKLDGVTEFTTACNFCSCGCGMVCQVRDGKLINLEGDPDHIINEGALCSKGAAMIAAHESPRRATVPLYRAPYSRQWQEISWDDAYNKIALKIRETRNNHWIATETDKDKDGKEIQYPVNRTDAMAFLGGAQNTNEEAYLLSKLSRLLGAVWVEHQARL